MFKKVISTLFIFLILSPLFCESLKIKFLKGNVTDKTAAVREGSGEEGYWLSKNAIDFALANKEIIGSDKELDALVVAAVLSVSSEYVKNATPNQTKQLENHFIDLFNKFKESATVQIAVISKVLHLKDLIRTSDFTILLNNYISSVNVNDIEPSVMKSMINALSILGDNESFVVLYNLWINKKYEQFAPELENTLVKLIPSSINETLKIINQNVVESNNILTLLEKNPEISRNSLCEIAENVLNGAILYVGDSSKISSDVIDTQLNALKILDENKWTKSSSVAVSYFEVVRKLYDDEVITDDQLAYVISTLLNIAPIDSVTSLILYLEELNHQKEQMLNPSHTVVLSVVKTLGAIGDKSAFDSLLAVTYLRYSESILSAARDALAGLRW